MIRPAAAVLALTGCGVHTAQRAPTAACQHPLVRAAAVTEQALDHSPGRYQVVLHVGAEPQAIPVIVDTGSANLVLPGDPSMCSDCPGPAYAPGPQAHPAGDDFYVGYGSGSGTARPYQDSVGLACGPQVTTDIGVLREDAGLPQGILGLAYAAVAMPADAPRRPFFPDWIDAQALDDRFSLVLCGDAPGAALTFGAVDPRIEAREDEVVYVPIVEETYYVVGARGLQIAGGARLGSLAREDTQRRVIVDSGTTMLLLPAPVVDALRGALADVVTREAIAGIPADFWTATAPAAQARLTAAEVALFPTLQLSLDDGAGGEHALDIAPETYLVRVGDRRVFGVREAPADGLVTLGQVFLENHATVFDRAERRLGFLPSGALCAAPVVPPG